MSNMTQTLLDFILNLLRDSNAKAAFVADPEKALADAGLSNVCSEDVSDAMTYVAEYHPIAPVGHREYNVSSTNVSHQSGGNYHPHPEPHATAVQQLEYITNNYSYVDDHDTVIDKSVNQNIWNDGVLNQRFDDHSVTATDHSVAAGRDIDGNVANGDGNLVGDGNDVGNTWYRDDHSINDSFTGNNIADRGGIAGTGNDGNVTNPHHSDVATTGATVDESNYDSHDTTIRGSFNDSHDRDSYNWDSYNDSHGRESHYESHNYESHNYESNNEGSFNRNSFNDNDESFNNDSASTRTEQDGLINANVSPAVNLPIQNNDVELLS